MSELEVSSSDQDERAFLGLAPFLRMDLNGGNLSAKLQELVTWVQSPDAGANDWLNLSIAQFCLGQRELGLATQAQALAHRRHYRIRCSQQPAQITLLVVVAPGDLAANIPIECLLEDCGADIHLLYVDPHSPHPMGAFVPEHDVLVCALSESQDHLLLLETLEPLLAPWPRAVVNAPAKIHHVERVAASRLFQSAPGVRVAEVTQLSRATLLEAMRLQSVQSLGSGMNFPILLRPQGSHAGKDLELIKNSMQLTSYAGRVNTEHYYACPYIDYRADDGLFHKIRLAFFDGQSFPCHMATSEHWMIHYLNAGMYEHPERRQLEQAFMEGYAEFERAHHQALKAIAQLTGLDYFAIDCAVCPDGSLLIFEIDHAMIIHAMDPPDLFPYKQTQMAKVRNAAMQMLLRKAKAFKDSKGLMATADP